MARCKESQVNLYLNNIVNLDQCIDIFGWDDFQVDLIKDIIEHRGKFLAKSAKKTEIQKISLLLAEKKVSHNITIIK